MGATQVVEPEAPPRPGSALAAVAIMAGIALVAAALVVAWARFGAPSSSSPQAQVIDAEAPESLAGGTPPGQVPPEIAAAVEAPVLAAVRLDQLPADLEGCGDDFGLEDARLESAIVTPDAAVLAVLGNSADFDFVDVPVPLPAPQAGQAVPAPPPPAAAPDGAVVDGSAPAATENTRAECAASWDGGWSLTMVNARPAGDFGGGGASGMGLADGSLLSTSSLPVPDGATWLVHDRGGYRLAYPVAGLPNVIVTVPSPPSGPFGAGHTSTQALFLDDAGTVLEEAFVGG